MDGEFASCHELVSCLNAVNIDEYIFKDSLKCRSYFNSFLNIIFPWQRDSVEKMTTGQNIY